MQMSSFSLVGCRHFLVNIGKTSCSGKKSTEIDDYSEEKLEISKQRRKGYLWAEKRSISGEYNTQNIQI